MTTTTDKLTAALARVAGALAVRGTGRNQYDGYDYVSDADLTQSVRRGLAAEGVVMYPAGMSILVDREATSARGGAMRHVTLAVTWRVEGHGAALELVTLGEGADRGDKGTYKAMTGARKYALRLLMQVATGEDPDAESPAAGEQEAPTSRAAQAPSRPAPAPTEPRRGRFAPPKSAEPTTAAPTKAAPTKAEPGADLPEGAGPALLILGFAPTLAGLDEWCASVRGPRWATMPPERQDRALNALLNAAEVEAGA